MYASIPTPSPYLCLSPAMQDFAVKLPGVLIQGLQELAPGQDVLCWQHIPKSLLNALHVKAPSCETLQLVMVTALVSCSCISILNLQASLI